VFFHPAEIRRRWSETNQEILGDRLTVMRTPRSARLCLAEQPLRESENPRGLRPTRRHAAEEAGGRLHASQGCNRFHPGSLGLPPARVSVGFPSGTPPQTVGNPRASVFATWLRNPPPLHSSRPPLGPELPVSFPTGAGGGSRSGGGSTYGTRLKRSRSGALDAHEVDNVTPRSQWRAEQGATTGSVRVPTAKHTRLYTPPHAREPPSTPNAGVRSTTTRESSGLEMHPGKSGRLPKRQDPRETPPSLGRRGAHTGGGGLAFGYGGLRELQRSHHSPSLKEARAEQSIPASLWQGHDELAGGGRGIPFREGQDLGGSISDLRIHDPLQREQTSLAGATPLRFSPTKDVRSPRGDRVFLARGSGFERGSLPSHTIDLAVLAGDAEDTRLEGFEMGSLDGDSPHPRTVDLAVMAGEGEDTCPESYDAFGDGRQGSAAPEMGSPAGRHTTACSRFQIPEGGASNRGYDGPEDESPSRRHTAACDRFHTPTKSERQAGIESPSPQTSASKLRGSPQNCDSTHRRKPSR
jgi:hypothetical protein